MIRIGARNSPLARAQADQIAAALAAYGMQTEFVPIRTRGDVDRRELTQIGGTGVFTGAVRDALLDGSIDVGVHSLKDLPTAAVDGLEVVAYPAREDTRDVLVGADLDNALDRPLVIGTGAPRRAVQLQQLAADRGLKIHIEPIRGNVDTRLEQVREGRFDATVLAAAGLRRLGRIEGDETSPAASLTVAGLPARLLSHEHVLPAPGQASLAVEASTALDSEIRRILTRLDSAVTRAEVLAERRFLAVLEAGCTAPVGARAKVNSLPRDGRNDESVRDPGADLTLVAVIGRTREDDPTQQVRSGAAGTADPVAGRDTLIDRGRLVTVSGHGSQADPTELGGRLARLVLDTVDPSEFGTT
jgi:hydroxymethylbilane synthase